MHASEKPYFGRLLAKLALNLGREISDDLIDVFFDSLAGYDIEAVKQAAIHINATAKKFPVVADFVELLSDPAEQHVGADEAWSIAVKTLDERETVIATDEIMQALEVARPVMELGDEVGARMAFRCAYGSLTKTGRPHWFISSGTDAALRHERVAEAVRMGRIAAGALSVYPAIEQADPNALVSGLIGYEPKATDKEAARAALGSLREMLGVNGNSARKGQESCAGYMLSKVDAHQRNDGLALLSQQMPLSMGDLPA